jgi:PAS domain S-box-containing protein
VRQAVAAYGLTLAAVAVAFVTRWLLDPWLLNHLPFVTFFVAVAAAAWLGGLRTALLATLLGLLLAWYYFVPTRNSFAVPETQHAVGLAMYVMVSLAFAGFGEALLLFERRAEARREELRTTLRENEAHKAAMVETALDCIISMDHEGKVIEFNSAAERTFGYRREDALGRELAELIIPPALREQHRRGLAHYLATGDGPVLNRRIELTAVRADGTEFDVELTVTRIAAPGPSLFTGFIRDISGPKQAERERRESEERFRTVIEQVKDYAIFTIDLTGRATSWNEGVQRVLGFAEDEFIGEDIVETIFTPEDVMNGVAEQELQIAAEKGSAGDDRWMRRKDGTRFFALGVTTAQHDDLGRVVGFTKIMRDQTDRKRLEDELRQTAANLSETDRRKSEFLAMLAHELRNPLAPIRNGLSIARMAKGGSEAAASAFDMMERQVGQMVRLIDDLLDVSRISLGKIELKKGRVELASIINHAAEAARPPCDEMGHKIEVTLPAAPIYLCADSIRLAQVVGNLLNNACKFSERGGQIRLTVQREGTQAVIRVQDAGIGIAAEQLPRIFELFTQVDTSLERAQSGLGIGLALVKRLVEMHDGSIEAHSAGLGHGSEFIVRLPITAEGETAPPQVIRAEPAKDKPRRILVVDDNRDSATSLAVLLKLSGNETHTAFDGQEALQAAETFRPDLVLLDIGLPKLNGYEVARRLRKEAWGKSMVLVALTGWGQEEDRQKSKAVGFDGHLVKPVAYDALLKLLTELSAATAQ